MQSILSLGSVLLKRWRISSDLSQLAAGQLLAIDPVQLGKFERGQRQPGRSTAARIEEKTEGMVFVASWDKEPPQSQSGEPAKGRAA